jgi:hypothetical protein
LIIGKSSRLDINVLARKSDGYDLTTGSLRAKLFIKTVLLTASSTKRPSLTIQNKMEPQSVTVKQSGGRCLPFFRQQASQRNTGQRLSTLRAISQTGVPIVPSKG